MMIEILPIYDRILIRRDHPDDTSAGGILIPETARHPLHSGVVLKVGRGSVTSYGRLSPSVKVGDKIFFSQGVGTEVSMGEEDLMLIRECDVLAIVGGKV